MKQQLLSTIAPGDEASLLLDAENRLQKARSELKSLREERSKVNREIAVRRRKLQEWKEKVPRGMEKVPSEGDMRRELERCGEATCRCVARVEILDERRRRLRFGKAYRKGLGGVEGFEKMWVIVQMPDGIRMCEGELWTGTQQTAVYLCLVDIETVSEREGLVGIRGMEMEGDMGKVEEVSVLDMKPYVPYCDAWAIGHEAGRGEDDCWGEDERRGEDEHRQDKADAKP